MLSVSLLFDILIFDKVMISKKLEHQRMFLNDFLILFSTPTLGRCFFLQKRIDTKPRQTLDGGYFFPFFFNATSLNRSHKSGSMQTILGISKECKNFRHAVMVVKSAPQ